MTISTFIFDINMDREVKINSIFEYCDYINSASELFLFITGKAI